MNNSCYRRKISCNSSEQDFVIETDDYKTMAWN